MCDEIEQGYINKGSMDVEDQVLEEINDHLSPDPERAEQLRKELKKGMRVSITCQCVESKRRLVRYMH